MTNSKKQLKTSRTGSNVTKITNLTEFSFKSSFFLLVLIFLVGVCDCRIHYSQDLAVENGHHFQPNELAVNDYDEDEEYYNSINEIDTDSSIGYNPDNVKLDFKKNEDDEKKDALIQAFKLKLLELLEVDNVPDPLMFNLKKNQVPEAVYKQHRLHQNAQKKVKHGRILKHRSQTSHSRHLREQPGDYTEDENIRFNSSITNKITLITSKIQAEDELQESWCFQNAFNSKYDRLIPLSCFKFNIENVEFKSHSIHSAKAYFKLENSRIAEITSYPLFGSIESNAHSNRSIYMYIEVNGYIIKRLNLNGMNALRRKYNDFKHIELKKMLTEILDYEVKPQLRIRLLTEYNLMNSGNNMRKAFDGMDENMALSVKFGDVLSKTSNRKKRSLFMERASSKNRYKKTKDCKDLRRLGYQSSNYTCCRETLSVTMEQLGWSHWILSPKVVEYKYCRGGCLTGSAPRYDNTHIIYRMFEMSNTFEASHCCNIYDYEKPITFIYGAPPNYQTRMISLNAKNCLCS